MDIITTIAQNLRDMANDPLWQILTVLISIVAFINEVARRNRKAAAVWAVVFAFVIFSIFALSTSPSPSSATPTSVTPPDQFIIDYWNMVSKGDHERAWLSLAPSFQQTSHENQFHNYAEALQELCRVHAEDTNVVEQTKEYAIASAKLVSEVGSACEPEEKVFDFHLVMSPDRTTWLISEVREK